MKLSLILEAVIRNKVNRASVCHRLTLPHTISTFTIRNVREQSSSLLYAPVCVGRETGKMYTPGMG